MQIGDYFRTPKGSMLRLVTLTENDECVFKHVDAGVILPPLPRTVAENRLYNVSAHAWDRNFVDMEAEIACLNLDEVAA